MKRTELAVLICAWLTVVSPTTAQPVIVFGLTNTPLGSAAINADSGYLTAGALGPGGSDGVSVHLGESDSGLWFWTGAGAFEEGYYMRASAYGRMNGSNDVLLASIQGGSAGSPIYPLEIDLSPLGPESLTFQLFYQGVLQTEFTRSNGAGIVQTDYAVYPEVNPLVRKLDGSLGISMLLSDAVQFVFPEALESAWGNELFVRANRPTNRLEHVSRMDLIGGGGIGDFYISSAAVGMFQRPHQSSGGVKLHAAGGHLRASEFTDTNQIPGVLIRAEPVSALSLNLLPVGLSESNSFMRVWGLPGAVELRHEGDEITITNEYTHAAPRLAIIAGSNIVHWAQQTADVSVPTNAEIRGFTIQAKTLDVLPGFHVRFAQTMPIKIQGQAPIEGDEIRFVMPTPALVEAISTVFLGGRMTNSITITNETTVPLEPSPRLELARFGNYLKFTWPDPNRVYEFQESPFLDWGYQRSTNEVLAMDPYAIVTLQMDPAPPGRFYRLHRVGLP